MELTFLGKDETQSGTGGCPSLYRTDHGTIVVQGRRLTDPKALSQLRDVLEGETFVEVPAELGKYWPSVEGLGQVG